MLDERIAQLARRQRGVVSRKQLRICGLSSAGVDARVRRHRLFPVVRGVFALAPEVDAWGRRYAAVLAAGGDPIRTAARFAAGDVPGHRRRDDPTGERGRPSRGTAPITGGGRIEILADASDSVASATSCQRLVVLSHWSAANVYGLIDRPPAPEHVTLTGTGSRRPSGVRIHRARSFDARDVRIAEGLPITAPARTILDAAVGASERQIRRLIREAEYQEVVGAGDVADAVRRNPFHPASRLVRRVDPETAEAQLRQTPIEDRMTAVLDRLPLGPRHAQLVVTGRSGRTYCADFAWPELRLIVETDGRAAHQRTTSFQSDRDRDADLAAAGWMTLRFTSLQLNRPDDVAATILATARTRVTATPHPR